MHRLTGSCHLRQKKDGNRVRRGRKWVMLSKGEAKKIRKLISI
jgi:ribosomal protein L35